MIVAKSFSLASLVNTTPIHGGDPVVPQDSGPAGGGVALHVRDLDLHPAVGQQGRNLRLVTYAQKALVLEQRVPQELLANDALDSQAYLEIIRPTVCLHQSRECARPHGLDLLCGLLSLVKVKAAQSGNEG